jgi:sulfite reductase beta subunit-like hemoprotein
MRTDFGIHMKGGIITERNADFCTIRIRAPAGIFSIEQLRGIATIAKKYGTGTVHCTTRQTLEIPHVNPALLKKVEKALAKNETPVGSEKDEIVNIIACPGIERCKFANIDTISLAKKLDVKYNDLKDLTDNDIIHNFFESEIDVLQKPLAKYERVRKFALLDTPFTIESGELTPTLKLKRKVIEEKHRSIIDDFYN